MSSPGVTLRALVQERTFEITVAGDVVTIDGREVACSLVRVGDGTYSLLLEGRSIPVVLEESAEKLYRATLAGRQVEVRIKDEKDLLLERYGLGRRAGGGVREVKAPMPGLVVSVAVELGAAVEAGARLLILEAMKMENEIKAEAAGVVRAVHVAAGDAVVKNQLLIEFEA